MRGSGPGKHWSRHSTRAGRQIWLPALVDFDDARDLITALREDTGGKDEWHVYQASRAALAAHGLDVAVDFCISERVPAGQVPRVIERTLLQEWAEHLWVPKTLSPHATWAYSWIRPPSRSRRSTRIFAPIAGGRERPAGGFCCSVLCGRWML